MFENQAAATQARVRLLSAGFAATAVTLTGGTAATSSTATQPAGTIASDEPSHKGAIASFFDNLFGGEDADNHERAGYTDTYQEAFKRGSYGVSVTTVNDTEADKAEGILNDAGAIDIDEKAATWKKEGWTGGAAATGAALLTGAKGADDDPRGWREEEASGGGRRTQGRKARCRQGRRSDLHAHDRSAGH